MKVKVLVVLLIVSLGLNIGVLVTVGHHWFAMRDFHGGPKDNPRLRFKMQKLLDLTDEQAKAFELGHQTMEKSNAPVKAELDSKRCELMCVLAKDNVDKVKVDKLLADISALQLKLERNIVNRSIDIRKNLTPEQRGKFTKIFDKGPKKPPFGPGFEHDKP
jgi:Spy/CpxP family protein refolding chaperone